jgi:ArsR family transcriptional regulator
MQALLTALRAAAEPTRLRLLILCAGNELSVGELTGILGQSQPRVSRHLKLLCDAGLLERFREGAFVFYRLAREPALASRLASLVPDDDPIVERDRARLGEIEQRREEAASAYFARNAHRWAAIRGLHVPEHDVEAELGAVLGDITGEDLLDVGTGTGRMLELFGPKARRAIGVDRSRDMLAVARAALERAGLDEALVRLGEMYALPFADAQFGVVLFHQVLHYAEHPADAIAEAARVLRPGGRLVIVDFAPHAREDLREAHAHRRLGFADEEVTAWFTRAGLSAGDPVRLPGTPLTVVIWPAHRPEREAITLPPDPIPQAEAFA